MMGSAPCGGVWNLAVMFWCLGFRSDIKNMTWLSMHLRTIPSFHTPAQLKPVTQLYVSVDAATPESLKAIDRPLFGDFWERCAAAIPDEPSEAVMLAVCLTTKHPLASAPWLDSGSRSACQACETSSSALCTA